jgi:transcriptional regulator with GAF, ATPase, and Fis domain
LDRVLELAINRVIEISGADRGMIIFFDAEGKIIFETAKNLNKEDLDHPEFAVGRAIIDKIQVEEKLVCLRQPFEEISPAHNLTTAPPKIFSVIGIPLQYPKKIFGAIYLDNRTEGKTFKPAACSLIHALADFIAIAAHHVLDRKRLYGQTVALEAALREKYRFESIVGHDPQMLAVLKLVAQIADTDAAVLIQGESGTGKELIARALHYNSHRSAHFFVPINCAAIPENLLESELFGHTRGAFTGAIRDKAGWFERANGGTIFLDEISEIPPPLQMKLLRILQTGEYARLGSTEPRVCDVRVIAATSQDLLALIHEKKFREALYYRLNVIEVWLPPLRERKFDIPVLAQHFLRMYGQKYRKENLRFSAEIETLLMNYDFPGNVRELENIIQRAIFLADQGIIQAQHLPANICAQRDSRIPDDKMLPFKQAKQQVVAGFEYEYIMQCLKASHGSVRQAAQRAGIHIKNFYTKMKQYKINPQSFKGHNKIKE